VQPGDQPQVAHDSPKGAEPKPGDKSKSGDKTGTDKQDLGSPKPENDKRPQDDQPRVGAKSEQQQTGGSGIGTNQKTGSPPPDQENASRDKKADGVEKSPRDTGEQPKSPSNSKKQSNSKGAEAGDESGGGKEGGGQKSPQAGVGAGGNHSPADEGASKANQQGAGETGTKGGDQVKSDHATGSGAHQTGVGAGRQGEQPTGGADQAGSPGSQPGGRRDGPGPNGAGNPTSGGHPGDLPVDSPPPGGTKSVADDPNLEYARKQTDLALEYLRDQMAKEKSGLLDQLGWSREDADQFLRRWEAMKRAAAEQGPQGVAARKQLDEAIKSLGLRPRSTKLHGGVQKDNKVDNLRDAGRSEPPGDWADQVHEYLRGVATGGH
jgi:hypothetical protein